MAKKNQQILENPLMIILISFLAILLIFSLQESKQKALLDSENLEQNRENINLLEKDVQDKEEFFAQTQNDLYKEKIMRNELIKNKKGEIVIQIAKTDFDPIIKEEVDSDKIDYRLQNWQSWWQLLRKN
jgi:cell division protein FtsB